MLDFIFDLIINMFHLTLVLGGLWAYVWTINELIKYRWQKREKELYKKDTLEPLLTTQRIEMHKIKWPILLGGLFCNIILFLVVREVQYTVLSLIIGAGLFGAFYFILIEIIKLEFRV